MEGVLLIRNEVLWGGCGFERLDIILGIGLECPFSILLAGWDRSAREGKGVK